MIINDYNIYKWHSRGKFCFLKHKTLVNEKKDYLIYFNAYHDQHLLND